MATHTGVAAVAAAVETIFPTQTSGIDGQMCGAGSGSFGTHTVHPCQPQPQLLVHNIDNDDTSH